MRSIKLGRAVRLVTDRADETSFRLGLEHVEGGTGHLLRGLEAGFDGQGIAFEPGDVLFGKLRPYLAKAWHADRGGAAVGDFHVYRCRAGTDPQFLTYFLLSRFFVGAVSASVQGAKMPRTSWNFVREIQFPAFSEARQRAIADYLDRETAQIDALIGKQEQLIETLRERRTAAVSSTFEVLERSRLQLRRVIAFLTSGPRGWGDLYADQGERFVRIGNLPRTDLDLRGAVQFIKPLAGSSESERTRLRTGDLLFSITAYLGSVAVVDSDWDGAYVSQHVALCRLHTSADARFVGWFMHSTEGQNQLKQGAAGGTKQQLSLPDIRELRVPLPPLSEQRRIAAYLDEQTAKIDALISKTERFIELSKERRAALITAAVTGQLDVREAG